MESFKTARISSGKWLYLFDSHSRDEKDLNVIYGSSALMKFNDLFEIEKYIQVVYLQYRDRQQAYFQIQFIEVRSIEKTEMYLQFAKNARRENDKEHSDSINKRQQVYYSNLKGSPLYHRINEKKLQYGKLPYLLRKGSLKFGSTMDKRKEITSFDKSVSKFKTPIKRGPVFVCAACNRSHYQKSVFFFKKYIDTMLMKIPFSW